MSLQTCSFTTDMFQVSEIEVQNLQIHISCNVLLFFSPYKNKDSRHALWKNEHKLQDGKCYVNKNGIYLTNNLRAKYNYEISPSLTVEYILSLK